MHSLIIEGDAGIAAALEIALQLQWPTGRVSWAHDSWGGLALFRQYRPDLTLLDLGLPQLGGREVFRQIRYLAPDRPVVLMADSGDPFPWLPGNPDEGPTGWLLKPFDHDEFFAAIRAVLKTTPPLHGMLVGV